MPNFVVQSNRGVEQLVARRAHNPEAGGSSPPPATKDWLTGQLTVKPVFLFSYCLIVMSAGKKIAAGVIARRGGS